jgi:hypothetical protein
MAQAQYVGVDGIARKVNKEYVGVDGVAREVTKGYVGVDGVAREYWSGEEEEMVAWAKYSCTRTGLYMERSNFEGYYIGRVKTETTNLAATYSSVSVDTSIEQKTYNHPSDLITDEGYELLDSYSIQDGSYINHINKYRYSVQATVGKYYYVVVYQITNIVDNGDGTVTITEEVTNIYEEIVIRYNPVEHLGLINVKKGQMPE